MAAEMWRMPSGRIGTIDLDQPADAVDALRELLASQGAVKEEAPGAEATAAEGSNQNPAEEPVVTIIAESTTVGTDVAPCPRFAWCTGHARVTNLEDIAAHFGTVARIVGPRGELVLRFWLQEPTLSFPEVEPPSFTIDGWDDWEILLSEVDVEIDEYLALLAQARAAMREFATEHPELGASA